MPTNKNKELKIKFDNNWHCRPNDDMNTNIMINTSNIDDPGWISIHLPHIIDKKEQETNHMTVDNQQKWWYYKQFEWKADRQNFDQRVYLIFESLNDHYIGENNNDYSSIDFITVWLNEIQIFSDLFQSPKISIDLTDQLLYKDDINRNNHKNTLIMCCTNASLSLHTYLLLPHDIAYAIEQENIDLDTKKNGNTLPLRKNRVLDYLVGFNNNDGRFDIEFNPKLKSPSPSMHKNQSYIIEPENTNSIASFDRENYILDHLVSFNDINGHFDSKLKSPVPSMHQNIPDIIVSEDHDKNSEEIVNNKENIEDIHVPRLSIVILIVGTRGDVQPFIAFGQTLRAAGHRVRLATHEKFRKYIRENGLEFYPLACNPDDLMSFMVKNGSIIPSMSSIVAGDVKKYRQDMSNILTSTWLACTEDDEETSAPFTAEVIIANPPSFGHVHCAQKLQIPLHMMFTMPWSATKLFPHAFCKVDYSGIPKDKINLLSYVVMDTLTWSGMRGLINDFRRNILDLPPLHTRQAVRMLFDEKVPHTYCWSPSLVPRPYDWPPHIDVSGYFFLNTNIDQFKPPDDLAAFLGLDNNDDDRNRKLKLSPPIYIGFGSITGNDSCRLLRTVLGALKRTGYRALLSGFDKDNDELPDSILKIGDISHDWLFQHVSAVCHHGGAGTTAAGLRAGKPSIIIPFFGDQFFWGNVVAKHGAGPFPLPGKTVTIDELAEAFRKAHESDMRLAAERLRDAFSHEDGCANALRMFHSHLPLSQMRSDLESTFAVCYRVDEYDLQVSRPVAQVLVAAGALDESQFRSYSIREWTSIYDNRAHVPTSGALKHTQKALSHIFIQTTDGMRRAATSTNLLVGVANGVGGACKDIGKGAGHLFVGALSLYGELTDVLDRVPSLYDPYRESDVHERRRVTDVKSGAKAAGLSIMNGWKDGVTGFVRKPRVGYHRHGILGGACGALVATANGVVKPTVGSLASVTWLGRGMYASVTKKKKNNAVQKQQIINKLCVQSSFSLTSSTSNADDQDLGGEEEEEDEVEDDDDIPRNIKFAAVVSGYSAEVCQQILDEFEKVKRRQEQISALSPNQTDKHRHGHLFKRHRRHSDSAL